MKQESRAAAGSSGQGVQLQGHLPPLLGGLLDFRSVNRGYSG